MSAEIFADKRRQSRVQLLGAVREEVSVFVFGDDRVAKRASSLGESGVGVFRPISLETMEQEKVQRQGKIWNHSQVKQDKTSDGRD